MTVSNKTYTRSNWEIESFRVYPCYIYLLLRIVYEQRFSIFLVERYQNKTLQRLEEPLLDTRLLDTLCQNKTLRRLEECTKWKKITSVMAEGFFCKRCKMMMRNEMSVERLNDEVETGEEFYYLGNALNVNGGSEKTVVVRRTGLMRLRECGKFLHGKRYSLKM